MKCKNEDPRNLKSLMALGAAGAFAVGAGLVATSCGSERGNTGSTVQDFTQSQLYGGSLPSKTLALTFDDGLGSRSVELARYLKSEGIVAAFFINGSVGANTAANLKSIAAMGHLLANHRHTHDQMRLNTASIQGVRDTDAKISPYVPGKAFLFRAPYGAWPTGIADFLNRAGLRKYVGSVFWDVGGETTSRYAADWDCWGRGRTVASCGQGYLNEIFDKREQKGIVLLHDIHSETVDMVKWMVPKLKALEYKFARVDTVPAIAQKIREAGGTPGLGIDGSLPAPVPARPGTASVTVAGTWIKRSPAQAASLPASDKCQVSNPATVLAYKGRAPAEAGHVRLDLTFADAGCPAFSGTVYVFGDHWSFKDE